MSDQTLYVSNDNVLSLYLEDELNATSLTSVVPNWDLKDENDNTVGSGNMTYVSFDSSTGRYLFRATLADTLAAVADKEYTCVVDADAGAGLKYHAEIKVNTKTRT